MPVNTWLRLLVSQNVEAASTNEILGDLLTDLQVPRLVLGPLVQALPSFQKLSIVAEPFNGSSRLRTLPFFDKPSFEPLHFATHQHVNPCPVRALGNGAVEVENGHLEPDGIDADCAKLLDELARVPQRVNPFRRNLLPERDWQALIVVLAGDGGDHQPHFRRSDGFALLPDELNGLAQPPAFKALADVSAELGDDRLQLTGDCGFELVDTKIAVGDNDAGEEVTEFGVAQAYHRSSNLCAQLSRGSPQFGEQLVEEVRRLRLCSVLEMFQHRVWTDTSRRDHAVSVAAALFAISFVAVQPDAHGLPEVDRKGTYSFAFLLVLKRYQSVFAVDVLYLDIVVGLNEKERTLVVLPHEVCQCEPNLVDVAKALLASGVLV